MTQQPSTVHGIDPRLFSTYTRQTGNSWDGLMGGLFKYTKNPYNEPFFPLYNYFSEHPLESKYVPYKLQKPYLSPVLNALRSSLLSTSSSIGSRKIPDEEILKGADAFTPQFQGVALGKIENGEWDTNPYASSFEDGSYKAFPLNFVTDPKHYHHPNGTNIENTGLFGYFPDVDALHSDILKGDYSQEYMPLKARQYMLRNNKATADLYAEAEAHKDDPMAYFEHLKQAYASDPNLGNYGATSPRDLALLGDTAPTLQVNKPTADYQEKLKLARSILADLDASVQTIKDHGVREERPIIGPNETTARNISFLERALIPNAHGKDELSLELLPYMDGWHQAMKVSSPLWTWHTNKASTKIKNGTTFERNLKSGSIADMYKGVFSNGNNGKPLSPDQVSENASEFFNDSAAKEAKSFHMMPSVDAELLGRNGPFPTTTSDWARVLKSAMPNASDEEISQLARTFVFNPQFSEDALNSVEGLYNDLKYNGQKGGSKQSTKGLIPVTSPQGIAKLLKGAPMSRSMLHSYPRATLEQVMAGALGTKAERELLLRELANVPYPFKRPDLAKLSKLLSLGLIATGVAANSNTNAAETSTKRPKSFTEALGVGNTKIKSAEPIPEFKLSPVTVKDTYGQNVDNVPWWAKDRDMNII